MSNDDESYHIPRLILASNRLPIVAINKRGSIQIEPGSGGLVTALTPVLRDRTSTWVGWPGVEERYRNSVDPLLQTIGRKEGYSLHAVYLNEREVHGYYQGFSNEIIWPLFHDLPSLCNFEPSYWRVYKEVNEKFATVIHEVSATSDFIWVHDYHLLLVGRNLREGGLRSRIGFFLHVPFPPLDIFLKLPWRFEVLESLMAYDIVGFQTERDRHNFLYCLDKLFPNLQKRSDETRIEIMFNHRTVRLGTFPISIDFDDFSQKASSVWVAGEAQRIRNELTDRRLVLSVDRLDYSKGITYRLRAFRYLLEHHPELHGKVSLIQFVVPSRTSVPKYRRLKSEINQLVGEINSEFSSVDYVPIFNMYRSLEQRELIAYYRACDVALVTPIKDGMNLIAKEFCASSIDDTGVLILSEFAGAMDELHEHVLAVNPYNIVQTANAIHEALYIPKEIQTQHMRNLRAMIRRKNVYAWVRSFLATSSDSTLDDNDVMSRYIPEYESLLETNER